MVIDDFYSPHFNNQMCVHIARPGQWSFLFEIPLCVTFLSGGGHANRVVFEREGRGFSLRIPGQLSRLTAFWFPWPSS